MLVSQEVRLVLLPDLVALAQEAASQMHQHLVVLQLLAPVLLVALLPWLQLVGDSQVLLPVQLVDSLA